MGNIEIFERMAPGYDTKERIDNTKIVIEAIRKELNGSVKGRIMDYGCGTGLVSLGLHDMFEDLTLIDASANMIESVQNKILTSELKNAVAICIDLENGPHDIGKFDLIMMSHVLLHIKDIDPLIERMYEMLNEDGRMILVDFDKNDRIASDMVHNGFDRTELTETLKSFGFSSVNSYTFHHGKNIFMGQDASLFLMNAIK